MIEKQPHEDLLQRDVVLPSKPSTWASSYTGVADFSKQPGGIITILTTVSSDFAKMKADTLAQEETDQKAYEEEMKLCSIEKARRAESSDVKTQERERQVQKSASYKATKKHVSDEKDAVKQYLEDLKP